MTSLARDFALLGNAWTRLGWPAESLSVLASPASILNIGTGASQNHFALLTAPADGSPMATIPLADVAAGYADPGFYTAPDGVSVVFRPLAKGGTSPNGSYPRYELRETTATGANMRFDAMADVHVLEGTTRIAHVPANDPDVVFAQLNDGLTDVVTLRTQMLADGSTIIAVRVGGVLQAGRLPFVAGRWYSWRIAITNGKADVYVDDLTTPLVAGVQLAAAGNADGWYWRAGAFAIFNATNAGITGLPVAADEYAEVWLKGLTVRTEAAPVTPPPPTNTSIDWDVYGPTTTNYPPTIAGAGITATRPTRVYNGEVTGATMTPEGNVEILSSNVTLDGWVINGTITAGSKTVHPSGVKILNCVVRGATITAGNVNVIDTSNAADVLIEHSDIFCATGWGGANGIGTKNYTARWNNIHHTVDPLRVNRTGDAADRTQLATIQGNWLHDIILDTPDPMNASRDDKKTHSDGIQIEGGNNILIEGNCIDGYHSTDGTSSVTRTTSASPWTATTDGSGILHPQSLSAIIMTPNAGWTITNLVIRNNWLRGGEITVNGIGKATGSLTGNKFDRGSLSGTALWQKSASTMTLSNNTYEDNGAAV